MSKRLSKHVTVNPRGGMKVEVFFTPEEAQAIAGLAQRFTDNGCIAEFVRDCTRKWSEAHLTEMKQLKEEKKKMTLQFGPPQELPEQPQRD